MGQTHTPECLEQQAKHAAWVAQWPGYCRECGAGGETGYPATWNDPADYGPCSMCSEQGICPRCGVPGLADDGSDCPHCGWAWGAGADDTAPPAECICPKEDDPPPAEPAPIPEPVPMECPNCGGLGGWYEYAASLRYRIPCEVCGGTGYGVEVRRESSRH